MIRKRARQLDYRVLSDVSTTEAVPWCVEQFGKRWNVIDNRQGKWTLFWAGPNQRKKNVWRFADEKDSMLFILRWS